MKALVLAGGGSKGAYELGVLRYLLSDLKTQYDILCGVSVGAINAAYLAQYPKGQEQEAYLGLKTLWDGLDNSKVKKQWFPLSFLEALWKPSLYNSSPLQKVIRSNLDPVKIRASGKKLRVGATGLDTGEYKVFSENCVDVAGAVLASSAFPTMLCPVKMEGQLWIDGGVRSTTPLKAAIQAGADDVDIIMCSPASDPSTSFVDKTNVPSLALRALDIMSDQVEAADLQICGIYNDLVAAGLATDKKLIKLRIVRPNVILLKNPLDFTPAILQKMQEQGYSDAKSQIK